MSVFVLAGLLAPSDATIVVWIGSVANSFPVELTCVTDPKVASGLTLKLFARRQLFTVNFQLQKPGGGGDGAMAH